MYQHVTCPTDAEKTKRIEQLELTVARLESTLSYHFSYGQPPAPNIRLQGPPPLPPKEFFLRPELIRSCLHHFLPSNHLNHPSRLHTPYHTLHSHLDTLHIISFHHLEQALLLPWPSLLNHPSIFHPLYKQLLHLPGTLQFLYPHHQDKASQPVLSLRCSHTIQLYHNQ